MSNLAAIATCVLLFNITLLLDITTDFKRWLAGKGIKHNRGAAIRCIGLLPAVYFGGWMPTHNWIDTTIVAWLICGAFWMLFDGFQNNKKDRDWWDTGSTGDGDALADKFLKRLSLTQIKIVKISMIAIPTAILIFRHA